MNEGSILAMVSGLMVQWGWMPYINAGLVLTLVFSAIVGLRRIGQGS